MTLEEQALRKQIRKMIYLIQGKQTLNEGLWVFSNNVRLIKENRLRKVVRNLILEVAAENPEVDPHASTGINFLRKLFNNTSMLTTLRSTYKLMTTDPEQRSSFRAHIIAWIVDTLKTIKMNDQAGTPKQKAKLTEQGRRIQLDIVPGMGDLQPGEEFALRKGGFYIDVPGAYGPDSGKEEPEERPELPGGEADDETLRPEIPGDDTTGRDTAEQVYDEIEGSIVPYFARLDNPQDHTMFETYLIANLKLYFDKWEKELQRVVQEPTNQEYQNAAASPGGGEPPPMGGEEFPPMGGEEFPPMAGEQPAAGMGMARAAEE